MSGAMGMIFSDTNNHWNLVFIFHASGLTITFMLAHHLYFKVDSLNALWFFFALYKYQKLVYYSDSDPTCYWHLCRYYYNYCWVRRDEILILNCQKPYQLK